MTSRPRIDALHVENYRALRDFSLAGITPLTALLGPNGSGKSTVFDVFAFLSECFTDGLRRAWDRRNRFKEMRSRGADGPITIEVSYREDDESPPIRYRLVVEEKSGPVVVNEIMVRYDEVSGQALLLRFERGRGFVHSTDMQVDETLASPELLAVSALGQLATNPHVTALRTFITGWHLSYLTADHTRGVPEAGPRERLSQTGDNLPNVIQYLKEQHPERLDAVLRTLASRVPRLESVDADLLADGRLLLQIKDAPFAEPILAKFASDGTLKMLAYLVLLYDPDPPALVGIEEPENQLHPRLLAELAEECRRAAERSQLLVTTHSPYFVNSLRPEELGVLYRDASGYTQARRVADMPKVREFMDEGALLGDLWMEGHFDAGDPLVAEGNRTDR